MGPTESSSRFSTLLTEPDSVLLTLVSLLLPSMMVLHLPSTLSLLLPPPSTQSFPLLQLIPLRLLRPRLLILLLLPLLLPLLRGRGVRLDSPMDSELPTPLMPPTVMLVFPMLMAFLTTDKHTTSKIKFCAIFYLIVLCL